MRARAVKPSSPIQESGRRLPCFGTSCRVRRSLPAVKTCAMASLSIKKTAGKTSRAFLFSAFCQPICTMSFCSLSRMRFSSLEI